MRWPHSGRELTVLVWNYHDDDLPAPAVDVQLVISHAAAGRPRLMHYRVDGELGNSYTAWQRMGSPQSPSAAQYSALEQAGKLRTLGAPQRVPAARGELIVAFQLPRQAVSLLRFGY